MDRKNDLPNTQKPSTLGQSRLGQTRLGQTQQDQTPTDQPSIDHNLENSQPTEIDPEENLREFHRVYEGIVEESRRQAINCMIMLEREFGHPSGPNFDGSPKPWPPRPSSKNKGNPGGGGC